MMLIIRKRLPLLQMQIITTMLAKNLAGLFLLNVWFIFRLINIQYLIIASDGQALKRDCSLSSSSSSTVITTNAPVPVFNIINNKLHRPWLSHLDQNKSLWQQKAAAAAAVAAATSNLSPGTPTSPTTANNGIIIICIPYWEFN